MSTDQRSQSTEALEILRTGAISIRSLIPWSSNYTFVVNVGSGENALLAIMKAKQGERLLHDFPQGLCFREAGVYAFNALLGWDLVPETIIRNEGPFGVCSLQRAIVDADLEENYFKLYDHDEYVNDLKKLAVFDLLINNADRKAGHVLRDSKDHLWAIDNGLSFHTDPKLRTVIWEFAGESIPQALRTQLGQLAEDDLMHMGDFITDEEIMALRERMATVAAMETFPAPDSETAFPWPLV